MNPSSNILDLKSIHMQGRGKGSEGQERTWGTPRPLPHTPPTPPCPAHSPLEGLHAPDPPRELQVPREQGHALGVDGAQVGVRKETHQEGL